MNKFEKAFDEIHASQQLKDDTLRYIRKKTAKKPSKSFGFMLSAAMACCMMICLSAFGVYSVFFQKISYISIDVNPSIELSLNRLNRVVSAKALNDDGEKIISQLNIENKTYEEALRAVLDAEETAGYLENDPLVSIAVYSENKATNDMLYRTLNDTVADTVSSQYGDDAAEVYQVDSDTVSQAQENGMTAGRYCEYKKIKESNPDFTPEECNNTSMRQLRQRTQQCQSDSECDFNMGSSQQQNCSSSQCDSQSQCSPEGEGKQYGKGKKDK